MPRWAGAASGLIERTSVVPMLGDGAVEVEVDDRRKA